MTRRIVESKQSTVHVDSYLIINNWMRMIIKNSVYHYRYGPQTYIFWRSFLSGRRQRLKYILMHISEKKFPTAVLLVVNVGG